MSPVERLIKAWIDWDHAAAHPPRFPGSMWLYAQAVEKEAALKAMGLDSNAAHRAIARVRRLRRAGLEGGMSIPDAIQTFINDQTAAAPHLTEGGTATTNRKAS